MISPSKAFSNAKTQRFCDYFVICGLDDGSGLEVLQSYESDGTNELSNCTPLERSYKPKILANYPENVQWNPFDQEAVRNLSLPSGLIFRTQKHKLEPFFHSFIITRENGSRTFGFSYIFYEEVESKHVISAIQTLQAMHLTELSSAKAYQEKRASQSRNIRNVSSALHQQGDRKSGGKKNRAQYLSSIEDNTRSLPRHFKLAAHKQQSLTTVQSFFDASKDKLYVSKAIIIICPLPYVHAARYFLLGLYHTVESGSFDLSLESYVFNFLYLTPLPPPGRSLKLNLFGNSLICSRPKLSELPLFDYFIGDLFRLLDFESVLQLFTCVLLENQILLYSKDLYNLMVVAECITGLLFPFIWQHVYVPILPSALHHFLDAPVPFIMGLHAQTTEFKENIPCETNLCFVDIDNNKVQIPEDLPSFPLKAELIQELLQTIRKYKFPFRNSTKAESHGSSPYRLRRNVKGRKNSWSHDSDSGMSSNEESISSLNGSHTNVSPALMSMSMSQTHNSHDLLHIISSSQKQNSKEQCPEALQIYDSVPTDEVFLRNIKFNNAVREIFLNRFVHIFSSYDHFVIQPDQDPGRMRVHNFDKATFLSDQPEQSLPFLSRFIETQMFATFIDRKISGLSGEVDYNMNIFDQRIKLIRNRYGDCLIRTPSYEPCFTIKETEEILEKRFYNPDIVSPLPREIKLNFSPTYSFSSKCSFPILDKVLLNMSPSDSRNLKAIEVSNEVVAQDASLPSVEYPSFRSVFVPNQNNSSPASIAQANWEFVKQLLQECKTKTKRMLVEKMGDEAAGLGHGEVSISGVEENTIVASLCDLLERIWAHGLHIKQKGKSPLWNFLINYEESEAYKDTNKPIDPQFLTPDLSARAMELNVSVSSPLKTKGSLNSNSGSISTQDSSSSDENRASRARQARSFEKPVIKPLPVSIAFDMRSIQGLSEIKTEIGYARAWIRLSLEKKVLSKHLRSLLADDELLRGSYKRTAFLRSEEEREQFLYHLLTLNAVEYNSFTCTYTNIVLPYRVYIFPKRCSATSNLWITVSGTLGETSVITVAKNTLEFVFQNKNLGLLLSLRIGHDNIGVSPKWMIDFIVVRNEVTCRTIKFPCGRWLGRDVDDGSTERLLVGEPFSIGQEADQLKLKTPPRARSPSIPRRFYDISRNNMADIQDILGEAVNNIVKYFFKPERDKASGSLTVLLCGENGLVSALEQVFQYGFKSSRFFGKNFYIWDYFLKVIEFFETELEEKEQAIEEDTDNGEYFSEQVQTMKSFSELAYKIDNFAENLGKDGKFQLFICLCAREHLLHRLPAELCSCPITREMYEKQSFLRDPDMLSYLVQVLESLDEFDIVLEISLTKGIE